MHNCLFCPFAALCSNFNARNILDITALKVFACLAKEQNRQLCRGLLVDMQIQLLQMRSDDDLMIEPHPFRKIDFNPSNPAACEILKNGIEIKDYAV